MKITRIIGFAGRRLVYSSSPSSYPSNTTSLFRRFHTIHSKDESFVPISSRILKLQQNLETPIISSIPESATTTEFQRNLETDLKSTPSFTSKTSEDAVNFETSTSTDFQSQTTRALENIGSNLKSLSISTSEVNRDTARKIEKISEILTSMKSESKKSESKSKEEATHLLVLENKSTRKKIKDFNSSFAQSINSKDYEEASRSLRKMYTSLSKYMIMFQFSPRLSENSVAFEKHKKLLDLWKETESNLVQKIVKIANIDMLRSLINISNEVFSEEKKIMYDECFKAIFEALESDLPEADKRKILDMMDTLVREVRLKLSESPNYAQIVGNRAMVLRLLNSKDDDGNNILSNHYGEFLQHALSKNEKYDLAEEIARIIESNKAKISNPVLIGKAERLLLDLEIVENIESENLDKLSETIEKLKAYIEKNSKLQTESPFKEEQLFILNKAIGTANRSILEKILENSKLIFNKNLTKLTRENFDRLFKSVDIEKICAPEGRKDINIREKVFSCLDLLVTQGFITMNTEICPNKESFLQLVIRTNDTKFLNILIEKSKPNLFNCSAETQETALEFAIKNGKWEAAEKIAYRLERGAEQGEVELSQRDKLAIRIVKGEKLLQEHEKLSKTKKGAEIPSKLVDDFELPQSKKPFNKGLKNTGLFLLASSLFAGLINLIISNRPKEEVKKNASKSPSIKNDTTLSSKDSYVSHSRGK